VDHQLTTPTLTHGLTSNQDYAPEIKVTLLSVLYKKTFY